jgi:hypothetical protein
VAPSLERSAPDTADDILHIPTMSPNVYNDRRERQASDSRADEDTNLTEMLRRIYRGFKLFWRREPFEISYVDYPGFLERPAGKKYCHYNYLDGQLYKHKWAIPKGFTQWLEVKLSLRPIGEMGIESIVASPGQASSEALYTDPRLPTVQAGGRRARTYTGEAELPGVMGSHFYHLKYGERLEHGETIDAVDIEKTKFAAPGSDTRKLKELDGDDRDTGGGDTAELTEPGGAHVEVVTAGESIVELSSRHG